MFGTASVHGLTTLTWSATLVYNCHLSFCFPEKFHKMDETSSLHRYYRFQMYNFFVFYSFAKNCLQIPVLRLYFPPKYLLYIIRDLRLEFSEFGCVPSYKRGLRQNRHSTLVTSQVPCTTIKKNFQTPSSQFVEWRSSYQQNRIKIELLFYSYSCFFSHVAIFHAFICQINGSS